MCEAFVELAGTNFRHQLPSPVVHAMVGDHHAEPLKLSTALQELADTSDLHVLRTSGVCSAKLMPQHQPQQQQPNYCATLLVVAQQLPAHSRACLSRREAASGSAGAASRWQT